MSEIHELCEFRDRPITKEKYLVKLKQLLKKGIPATYTIEDAEAENQGLSESKETSTTTPLHVLCESIPLDASENEEVTILAMIDELFLNGAGWCLINKHNETPGCVLLRRGLHHSKYWDRMIEAGVRAEVVFRKLEQLQKDTFDSTQREALKQFKKTAAEDAEIPELVEADTPDEMKKEVESKDPSKDPTKNLNTYLHTKLAYTKNALVTEGRCDGVMMDWEEKLMKAGCDSLFHQIPNKKDVSILNIGFGMGIIDTMIEERNPTKHYICEAHPDVLRKMKEDGWMEKPNIVVLKGKWQDTLPPLLDEGIYFDGIYYDTYSEHYQDMLNLFDLIVGLLKMTGTFSFFNGLGADRLVCYEVYKKVAEIDLADYGLSVKYKEIKPPENVLNHQKTDDTVWKGIRRAYWKCPVYYHPEVTFTS